MEGKQILLLILFIFVKVSSHVLLCKNKKNMLKILKRVIFHFTNNSKTIKKRV